VPTAVLTKRHIIDSFASECFKTATSMSPPATSILITLGKPNLPTRPPCQKTDLRDVSGRVHLRRYLLRFWCDGFLLFFFFFLLLPAAAQFGCVPAEQCRFVLLPRGPKQRSSGGGNTAITQATSIGADAGVTFITTAILDNPRCSTFT